MKAYFGLTNWDWFQFLRAEPQLDEVNFWRPSDTRNFSLPPGSPFIFKLHQAHGGMIAGFGYLAGYTRQPMWAAWEAFERKNGAASFSNCHRMIATIRAGRGLESDPAGTFEIGCLMLSNPVFFDRSSWILPPSDWPRSGIQVGKPIDITGGEGKRVWDECQERAGFFEVARHAGMMVRDHGMPRYGEPVLVRPRLGQGGFRFLVTDAYEGACAVSNEHSRPVLEAAHIKPFAEEGPHTLGNGLLLRTDIHRLFDKGYVTVSAADHRFVVSRRLKAEFENGRTYYAFDGKGIHLPKRPEDYPAREFLEWHNSERFRG